MIKIITNLYEGDKIVNFYKEWVDDLDDYEDYVKAGVKALDPNGWSSVEFIFYDEDGKVLYQATVENEED